MRGSSDNEDNVEVELARRGSSQVPPELTGSTQLQDAEKIGSRGGHAGTGLSYRRLVVIMTGLCLTIFLTALDQVLWIC